MAKLSDIQIRSWISTGERFEGKSDGDGLILSYRKEFAFPVWRFRYRLAGKQRVMNIGTCGQVSLADEYFQNRILGRWKHPNILRARIEKDIKPQIGKLAAEDVKPGHIDTMLRAIIKRGAPTMANDVLRWTKRIFDYAIKRHIVQYNPVSAFDLSDAGGKESSRERALTREELIV